MLIIKMNYCVRINITDIYTRLFKSLIFLYWIETNRIERFWSTFFRLVNKIGWNRWSRGWNWTSRDISNIWSHDGNRSRFRKWNVCLISNARSTPAYNHIRVRVPFPRPFFRAQRDPSIASSSKFARLLVARKKKKKEKKEQKWKRNGHSPYLSSFIIIDQIVYFV